MARKEILQINDTLEQALDLMKKAGADYAGAAFSTHQETSVKVRDGKVENIETAKPMEIELHMRIGEKSEGTSISSRSLDDLKTSVLQLADAVKRMPDNPYDGPADSADISRVRHNRSLDLIDRTRLSLATMIESAQAMEAAAMAVPGIALSEGASASWYKALSVVLNSRGEQFVREGTKSSRGVSVIARSGADQRTGSEGCSAVYASDLMSPEAIGLIAGTEAVQSLNPGKALAGNFPVVFHPALGASLLGHFVNAIKGEAIVKKSSFLTEAMNRAVFAPGITILDNPHLARGHGSTRFSGSGLATQPMTIVDKGVLKTWFMSLEDARRLHLENAAQKRGSTNLTIEPGTLSPAELVADIKEGLFVTGLMGQGIDLISGQYSRAATGFWIKDGQIDYSRPVAKASISSTLQEMFAHMDAANDLQRLRSKIVVPTLRVASMSIS